MKAMLGATRSFALFLSCSVAVLPAMGDEEGVARAMCTIGNVHRHMELVFSALQTQASAVYANASDLASRAWVLKEADVPKDKLQRLDAALRTFEYASKASDAIRRALARLGQFARDVDKEYYSDLRDELRERRSGRSLKECKGTAPSEMEKDDAALGAVVAEAGKLSEWAKQQEEQWRSAQQQATSSILHRDNQYHRQKYETLNRKFVEFMNAAVPCLATVGAYLPDAMMNLPLARAGVEDVAKIAVTRKVSECRDAMSRRTEDSSNEKLSSCKQFTEAVRKIQERKNHTNATTKSDPTDAREVKSTDESTLQEVKVEDVVALTEDKEDLKELLQPTEGPVNANRHGMTTAKLVIAIVIPVLFLLFGLAAYLVLWRRTSERKAIALDL
ncbi:hypothetical protein, conserved in T. vivax [Trypanosoma vivax Y486]|uniref:65 kDa invariant surface glycoprotein n=1 Tax=Trypanosoma vivax (strain Y486) TaxID=1055687 RepID=F9WKJ1_TRYVY|nr:hypothetical protein, conserved in T. vivax [Trypanosoma vivax Y486]|eukprot:CCD18011.1 hypothetical protein, conserved in T. vivax [Trypanosoma vivax Y486]